MDPKSPEKRARSFRATRDHHAIESAEDYTELVMDLITEYGEARTCQIAEHIGVSHVTAIRTIRRLERDGYLLTAPHKPVELTPKGRKTARFAKHRHNVLLAFLQFIGVPERTSEVDVEGMEHHVSKTTLRAIEDFMSSQGESIPD